MGARLSSNFERTVKPLAHSVVNVGSKDGGILNNAHRVHFEGTTMLSSHTIVHNTIVQPDVSKNAEELLERIAEWLSDINYHAIQADNYAKRAEGTGEWALDDPEIRKWLEGVLGVLWGIGIPGAGKTVLTSFIIDHLLQKAKANKRICVAFAFSHYADQFTSDQALGGLLRQVVQDHPGTLPFVKPMYDHHRLRKTRPSQKELLGVLREIFMSDLFDELYCALDGLDEALAETQVDLLDALSSLPLNLLIISRPLPLLKERVPAATFVDIVVRKADIEQVIEEKLRRTKMLRNLLENEGWKERVLEVVWEKSSGMFVVASLQIDMLGRCMHIKDLRSALETLPVGVNAVYEATMERIKGGAGSDLALQALTWLVYARESLKMEDLRHALAVDTTTLRYDLDLLVDAEVILSVCYGLLSFEPETKFVRLVHYTAREYLQTYFSRTGTDAQATMACTCVARLRDCGFENYPGASFRRYHQEVIIDHPFLAYAYRNWVAHAHSSKFLPHFIEVFVQRCHRFPWNHNSFYHHDFLNAIQLAAACNFHGLLLRWLGSEPSSASHPHPPNLDVNSTSAEGRTALALAVIHGHLETVELLIGVEGVVLRSNDHAGEAPLMQASRRGHAQVVEMLLDVVDADYVNMAGYWTVLMHAAFEGHTDVIKSLLRVQGIDVNAREPDTGDGEGHSALTLAVYFGHLEAAKLLLGVGGIDVNASHWRDGTALAQASGQGNEDVVKILLQRDDLDVNSSQCKEGTALMRAAYRGHKGVVELLLQRDDIEVNATRPDGSTALSWALIYHNLEIAELLRSHGAR